MKYEHNVIDVGYTQDGDWLRIQSELLDREGENGWELVSVVLLETEMIKPPPNTKNLQPFFAFSAAMYFKRRVRFWRR